MWLWYMLSVCRDQSAGYRSSRAADKIVLNKRCHGNQPVLVPRVVLHNQATEHVLGRCLASAGIEECTSY